jgi:glutaredoxin
VDERITLWTLPGCRTCERVKAALQEEGFEERSLRTAMAGDDPDCVDVAAQLAMQDHRAPVIRIDGEFISPADLPHDI